MSTQAGVLLADLPLDPDARRQEQGRAEFGRLPPALYGEQAGRHGR